MEYGLIGEKLGHSYSPLIHRCFGDYDYRLYPLPPEEVGPLLTARDFKGLNVTIPYKQTVLPFCDEVSDTVRTVGSANTLIHRNGRLTAHNTDLPGFLYMLKKGGISLAGKKVLILGSGGTSLTAQAACKQENARETIVVSRRGPVTYENMALLHPDAEVMINATPVGMYPETGLSPADLSLFPHLTGVADVIYNPSRTALLRQAEERGIPRIGGLWMLSAQGYYAAELFLDKALPEDLIQKAYRAVRADCLNLVFIGMPGSGKSTLGRMAAKALNRPFVDLDAEIEKRHGPIPEIFSRQGEAAFRDMETEVIREYGKESGLVISAGGGAILRKENRNALRQNAAVCWLKRPLENLSTKGRPLSTGLEALKQMQSVRTPLYRQAADYAVENAGDIRDALNKVLEGFHENTGD